MTPIFGRDFNKQLARLDTKIEHKFYERLRLFLQDPYHPLLENHGLHGKHADKRSINVTGDYRALFKTNGKVVTFTDIGTHPQLYG